MPTNRPRNTDGRIARGERTRDAIVDAHTTLLREGVLKPTAKVIAERAEVSVRTLWANFKDLEALLIETTAYWDNADLALRVTVDPDAPLAERIEDFCAQRSRRLENIAPAARSAVLGEPFSAALARSRQTHVDRLRSEIETLFAHELAAAAGSPGDALKYALITATGWPNWQLLRDDFNLTSAEIAGVMRHTLHALLDPLV